MFEITIRMRYLHRGNRHKIFLLCGCYTCITGMYVFSRTYLFSHASQSEDDSRLHPSPQGKIDSINVDKAVEFVLSCMNFDGGFGCRPGSESHAGQVSPPMSSCGSFTYSFISATILS